MVRRWLALATLAMLVVGLVAAPALASGSLRVLIRAADPGVRAQLAAAHGVRWDFGAVGFTADVGPAAYAALALRPGVSVSLVPVRTVGAPPAGKGPGKGGGGRKAVPNDPTPWGIEAIYNDPAIASTAGGEGRIVAVLDTGVASHVDLKKPKQCLDFTKGATPKRGCSDGHGHGTHVTGTILANAGSDGLGIWGVAPGADYFAYKVCGNSGYCFADDVAMAIRYAADNGAHIISMSLGGSSPSELEHNEITYAVGKGVLVIAAAGNSGPNPDTIGYPGAFPEVVAVAALREDLAEVAAGGVPSWDGEPLVVAYFSSRGQDKASCAADLATFPQPPSADRCIEVAAPGRHVESTMNDGAYATWSGTSMATPHVSGLAAKVWAANPGLTNHDVRAWLQSAARNNDITLADLQEGDGADPNAKAGYDITAGFGFPRVGGQ